MNSGAEHGTWVVYSFRNRSMISLYATCFETVKN